MTLPFPSHSPLLYLIQEKGTCWLWMGNKDGRGYPLYSGRGARQLVWEAARDTPWHRSTPTCHNPLCVNPDHMKRIGIT